MANFSPSELHLIFTATPGYGHVRPLKSLAKSLTARSYSITFITSNYFGPSLEGIDGVDFIPFTGAANMNPEGMEEEFPERRKQPQDATLPIWDLEHIFLAGFDDQLKAIKSVMDRPELAKKKIVLLHDGTVQATAVISLESPFVRRVPVISVVPFPILFHSKDAAPFGFGLPSQGEEKNQEMNAMVTAMFDSPYRKAEQLLKSYECPKQLPHRFPIQNWLLLSDAWLQLTIPQLEYPRSDLPEHFRFIGYILGSNDKKDIPEWYQDFVVRGDASKPLVVVTAGTLPAANVHDLILPTLEACRGLPVRLVVCAVHANLPAGYEIPDNARVAPWLPFEDVFEHTSVLVSNGGYGGINQAFAAGIPMVVAGTTEDKIETTARAAMTGAAINLQTKAAKAEDVRKALERVLNDKLFKEKALELKKIYSEYDAVACIEETISELVAKFYN